MLPKHPLYYHTLGIPLVNRTFKAEEQQYQLVNDNFTDAITGWVANISSGYTMVIDDGRLKFDAGIPWAGIIKTFSTVPGKKYHISVKVDMGTTQALYLIVRNVGNVNNTVVAATTNGAYEIDFTAVDATTTFHLEGLNGSSTATRTFYIDDVLIQEATSKTYRFGFNGKEDDKEVEGQQDYGFRANRPGFKHNGFLNNENDRTIVAQTLAAYVIAHRVDGEEITLIGHSHGGNIAILAADIIYQQTGQKVNLITIATPVYEGKNEAQDPANHPSINDHLHFWSKSDPVQGGLAGGEVYNNSMTRVFEVKDDSGHSFDVKNPAAITKTGATPLAPVISSNNSSKPSNQGGSGMGMMEKDPLEY